jgi:hypothetical protein
MLTRKERQHVEALEARLSHLRGDHPERRGDPAYPPGEAYALAWALSVLRGIEEPLELRVERLQDALRKLTSRVGRIEHELEEEDDEL